MEILDRIKSITKSYDEEVEEVKKEILKLYQREMGNGFDTVTNIEALNVYLEVLEDMKQKKIKEAMLFEAEWICE